MGHTALEIVGLFFAGLLAGEEFVIRYGVQPALTQLEDRAHLQARQALIRRLRILVPSLMLPTVVLGISVLIRGTFAPGAAFRWAGAAALLVFVLSSFLGTVPINIKVVQWQVEAPPADWKAVIRRWEQIDVLRSSAAMLAFVLFLIAASLRIAER